MENLVIEKLNNLRNEVMQLLSSGIQSDVSPLFQDLESSILEHTNKKNLHNEITDLRDMVISVIPLNALNNSQIQVQENIEVEEHGIVDKVEVITSIFSMTNVRRVDIKETKLYSDNYIEVSKKSDLIITYVPGHIDIIENIVITEELQSFIDNYGLKVRNKIEESDYVDIPENL